MSSRLAFLLLAATVAAAPVAVQARPVTDACTATLGPVQTLRTHRTETRLHRTLSIAPLGAGRHGGRCDAGSGTTRA